ncbi:MAG: LapA family protein [Phycisphaerales bacterium]
MPERAMDPADAKPFYARPKFITSVILAIIFLILIFQNSEAISIDIFFWTAIVPAALLYLIFSLIGFTVGWLLKQSHAAAKSRR